MDMQSTASQPQNQPSVMDDVTVMPPTSVPPLEPKRTGRLAVILILVLILGGAGYASAAYFFNLWPFAGTGSMSKQKAFADLVSKILAIESSNYEVKVDINAEPREAGATSFDAKFPEFENEKAVYKRDYDQIQDLQKIVNALRSYYSSKKSYPATLDELIQWSTSKSGGYYFDSLSPQVKGTKFYIANANKDNYSLTLIFETDTAVETIQKAITAQKKTSTTFSGKSVTFTKDSPTYFYLSYEPPRPSWVTFLENQDDYLMYASSDLQLGITTGGTAQKNKDAKADAQFHMGGKLSLGDFNVEADGDFLKKGEDYFGRINKFPSIFWDISKVKNQWIKVTPDDIAGYSEFSYPSTFIGDRQKKMSQLLAQIQTAFRLMNEEKVLDVNMSLPDEKIGEESFYAYLVSFNGDKVVQWYERLSAELKKEYGDDAIIKLDETSLRFMKTDSFQKYLAYIKANTTFRIFIDKKSGFPQRMTYRFRLVPSEKVTKLKDKQFISAFQLDLNNINEPIQVKEPEKYITFEDAQLMLTGESKESYRFNKQIDHITALRNALTAFNKYTGVYPAALNELTKKRNEVQKKATPTSSRNLLQRIGRVFQRFFGITKVEAQVSIDFPEDFTRFSDDYDAKLLEVPFLKTIPHDVYSGKEYSYVVRPGEEGYALTYQLAIPKPDKNQESSGSFFSYRGMLGVNAVIQYVEGTNTATAKQTSSEAKAAMVADDDGDKLPRRVEQYYGSDDNKKDTDGDGYSDYGEVKNGYNPVTSGKLDYNDQWYDYSYKPAPAVPEQPIYIQPQQQVIKLVPYKADLGYSYSYPDYYRLLFTHCATDTKIKACDLASTDTFDTLRGEGAQVSITVVKGADAAHTLITKYHSDLQKTEKTWTSTSENALWFHEEMSLNQPASRSYKEKREQVYVTSGGLTYFIVTTYNVAHEADVLSLYNQMLATFKFPEVKQGSADCTDTDGSTDFTAQGHTTGYFYTGRYDDNYDYCQNDTDYELFEGKYVAEFSCYPNQSYPNVNAKTLQGISYRNSCAHGCKDGACIP